MADRIDIGTGPRLGFDPTDTGGFEYTGQKALTADEYASRNVNFQREFLGLPDLAEESGIETSAPEVGQDIDVTKDEASGPETDLIGIIGDTNTYNFDAKKDGFQPKFGYQETGASEFSSYSDYLEKSGKMDRVNLVEKIYEPLMKGDFKGIDFSALGQEAREGVQAVKDAPQTLSGEFAELREEGLAGIKERIQKGAPKALAGLFSSLGGLPGSVIGSVIGGTDQLDEFGDPSRRPSGPLSVLYDARMSRAFDIMNDIKSAHSSGTIGDRGYSAKLGGGRKLLRARGAKTYFDMGGLTFEQAKNIEAFNEGYIVDTYSFDQKKGKDFFGRDKNVKVEDIGGAFAGKDGYYTPNGRYYSTRYQTTSAAGPESGINKLADQYGVTPDVAKQAIMDARAGKGTVKGNIDAAKAAEADRQRQAAEAEKQRQRNIEAGQQRLAGDFYSDSSDEGGPSFSTGSAESAFGTSSSFGDYSFDVDDDDAYMAQGGTVGMAAGGAMAAGMGSGFVDRPPSQVPEEQTVADNVETQLPEGAFVINAAAVEFAGEQDIKKMLNDAQKEAVRRGITIDNPENSTKLIDVAISRGEVTVAPYLAKIIGYDRLNKINNRGKPETKERLQEAAQGGFLSAGYHVGGEVHAHDSMQADLELNVEDIFGDTDSLNKELAAERQARKTQRNVDRANIAFGDMEAGFDLLNQYDWNNLLRAGLRDINLSNQTETEEDFILKSYGAGGMYQPYSDKVYVGATSKLTEGFATPRAQSHVFAHELMHRGAQRLENDAEFEAILKGQLSELEAFLKAGSELGTSQTRQNKEKRRTGTTSQHAYIYSVTGQALVNRGGLDESGLTALIKRNFNFMTDDQQSNFIKSAGVIDNSPKNPKRRMQFLLDPELSREQLKELATRTNQLLMENAVTKAYEKRIADRPQEATPERQEEKVLDEARQN
tara:strand:- start:663 stop:3473 length:2811 start_codon:yes stop_codon:yes gene_type:complete